jgi:hypothetical protein
VAPIYKVRDASQVIVDITDHFRLYEMDLPSNAEEGTVAQGSLVADDPDATLDIGGLRLFTVEEDTSAGSNSHMYVGYTAARRVRRGDNYRVTTQREWEIDLTDLNTVLSRRVFDRGGANRPAETDIARVQWLLGTEEMTNYVDDDLYVATTGGVAMDAVDYRGQRPEDVLNDCAQQSGRNYFVWYRQETGEFSLFYDHASSESYTSLIRLTNVLSEVDDVFTYAFGIEQTELSRSPDRVNHGAYVEYDGGVVYERDLGTAAEFAYRDAVMPAENVKTVAKATARAQRYLSEMSTEEDVITTTVVLPAAKVNLLMQGMRVQFKATHLPGYEVYRWLRALNRSVRHLSEDFYELKLELSAPELVEPEEPGTVYEIVLMPFGSLSVETSIEVSDNGTDWTELFSKAEVQASLEAGYFRASISEADRDHRYWSVLFDNTHGGGFFGGARYQVFRLLDDDGVDHLGYAGEPGSDYWQPAIGIGYVGSVVNYTGTSNGDRAQMYGRLADVPFTFQYPGPVTGDFSGSSGTVGFGLHTGVPSAGLIRARWVWDIGA